MDDNLIQKAKELDSKNPKNRIGFGKLIIYILFFPFTISIWIWKKKRLSVFQRISLIVLLWIGFFTLDAIAGTQKDSSAPSYSQSTPTPTPVSTANWKTYSDPLSHYSIKYPPEWSEVSVSSGGIDTNHNPEANTVYITPKDTFASDDGIAISDRQNSVLSWWGLPTGSCGRDTSLCQYKKFVSKSGIPFDLYYIQAKGNYDAYGYSNGNIQLDIEFNHNVDTNIKNAVINSFIYPATNSATINTRP